MIWKGKAWGLHGDILVGRSHLSHTGDAGGRNYTIAVHNQGLELFRTMKRLKRRMRVFGKAGRLTRTDLHKHLYLSIIPRRY